MEINNPHITLRGEDGVVITYGDYARAFQADGKLYGTFRTYTVLIAADYITFENITVQNTAGYGKGIEQAVALYADGDMLRFSKCRFLARQDTLFLPPLPPAPMNGGVFGGPRDDVEKRYLRHLFENCYVEGDVDFIFGSAAAIFINCEIHSLTRHMEVNGYVTAASTPEHQRFGFVFIDCHLTSDCEEQSVYLGRPWRNFAKTVFINCEMGSHIKTEGFHNWDKTEAENTIFYAEHGSYGAGAVGERAAFVKKLDEEELQQYTIENIFNNEV